MSALFPIFQYAYFVNDIEEAAHKWHRLYGAGPFVHVPHHVTDKFQYRGTDQEADVSYGFGYLADNQIQFIVQHCDTPSIYRDMYKAGEEGFIMLDVLLTTSPQRVPECSNLGSTMPASCGQMM